jgi:uncharacterized protein
MALNVFGEELITCSNNQLTGFFRDGCCNTSDEDTGEHTICVVVTADFLEFSKAAGNDLSTPRPEHGFEGLKPGDQWCLCAMRWIEAKSSGLAPQVVLEATHELMLDHIALSELVKYAVRKQSVE